MIRFLKDKKNLVITLLCLLFLIKIPQEPLRFTFWVLAGVFLCWASDFFINSIFFKRNIFSNSAVITGFIISGILDYRLSWFLLVIFSILSIASKYTIRFKNRHIFNPANFSLFLAALFKLPLTWGIESNVFLIVVFGIYFAYSFKKFSHVLGFLVFFISLFFLAKINPFTLISWFFVFIMLIEPKTSGYGTLKGFIFGGIAGTTSFLIFRYLPGYDSLVLCLFLANLSNPLLDKIRLHKSTYGYSGLKDGACHG